MIIEKIKENKFKILLSLKDLENKNIDFHSFMSSNIENQSIFKEIIKHLKSEYNFCADISSFSISTFYIYNKSFVIIITSSQKNDTFSRVITNRHIPTLNDINIYRFENYNEMKIFFDFIKSESNFVYNSLLDSLLFKYNNLFFLVIRENEISDVFYTAIDKYLSEFSFKINNPNNFYIKLIEYGDKFTLKKAILE